MALPKYVQKTLGMKPEVSKIFDDLDAWLDHCRFNLLPFEPSDLYRSQEYKSFQRWNGGGDRKPWNGERKPRGEYNRAGGQPRNNQR
jgi:hypothetical protein